MRFFCCKEDAKTITPALVLLLLPLRLLLAVGAKLLDIHARAATAADALGVFVFEEEEEEKENLDAAAAAREEEEEEEEEEVVEEVVVKQNCLIVFF